MFIGRSDEIREFIEFVKRPEGQAALVIGNPGMGKSTILNRFENIATTIPDLGCSSVNYDVTQTDSVDSVMSLIMDGIINAAGVNEGSFAGTPRRIQQWKAFWDCIPKANKIAKLISSLKYNPQTNIRTQFKERLQLVSKLMKDDHRLIVFIDPEKYMQPLSDESWTSVVRDLPPKIKFVFAQRPEDVLASSRLFKANKNVIRIPNGCLGGFDDAGIDQLIHNYKSELPYSYHELKVAISPYKNHPYATVAALELLKDGKQINELPNDPTTEKIVEEQWSRIISKGTDTIRLFEAYATLEVPIPDNIIEYSVELPHETYLHISSDSFVSGLLRSEGAGKRIYHAILSDYILNQTSEDIKHEFVTRANMRVFNDTHLGFFDKVRFLELLQEQEEFDDEVITEFIASLNGQPSLKEYFVRHCHSVLLVRKLYKKGFFNEIPILQTKFGYSYYGWIEGVILINLADQIPDIICDIAKRTEPDNLSACGTLVAAIAKLEVCDIKVLWPIVLSWIDGCQWNHFPNDYKKMAMTLLDNDEVSEVLEFLSVTLKPKPSNDVNSENEYLRRYEAVGKFNFYELERYIKPIIENLELKYPLASKNTLELLLSESIQLESAACGSDYPKTGYWRSAIEEHEQDHFHKYHKDFLLVMLRNSLERAVEDGSKNVRDVIIYYLRNELILYRRIALHLIRSGKDKYLDLAFNQLIVPDALDTIEIHHEIFLLLKDVYPFLNKARQKRILSIVKSGQDKDKTENRARWIRDNFNNKIDLEDSCKRIHEIWIRDRLQMIKCHLSGREAKYYSKLVSQYGENDHAEFLTYHGECESVEERSPITLEEWNALSAKECTDYIILWEPTPRETRDPFNEDSHQGLATLMATGFKSRWLEFEPETERLLERTDYPIYAYELLKFISNELGTQLDKKQDKPSLINFNHYRLILIVEKAIHKWMHPVINKDGYQTGYQQSVCKAGIDVIKQILLLKDRASQQDRADLEDIFGISKNLLLELCSHADPTPEQDDPQQENYVGFNDPITVAINHIRPLALEELLRYSVIKGNVLKLKKPIWEAEVKNKVTDMLNDDTAYSVRSVFGAHWDWLYHLDESWARKNHNKIFPLDISNNRYLTTAWDRYIIFKYYVNDAGYDLMRPLYIIAIDNAINGYVTKTHLRPTDALGDHLMWFYLFDIESLSLEGGINSGNPLAYVYSHNPNEIHSRMTWRLWHDCCDMKDTKRQNAWEKAKLLWQFRLDNVLEKDWNEHFSDELSYFIHLLTIPDFVVRPDEIKDLLIKSIPALGMCNRDQGLHELIDYLGNISDSYIDDAAALLLKVFDKHGANFYFDEKCVEAILENTTKANQDTKIKACDIVHKLGESGKEWARQYLDRLRV